MLVAGLVTSLASAASGPLGISPGRFQEPALIDTRCPTFSWVAQPEATGYEIVVLEWAPGREEPEPVLRQVIPGGASSWTPALDQCLEWGGRYAWSFNARGSGGAWSQPLLFEVASREIAFEARPGTSSKGAAGGDRGEEPAAGSAVASRRPVEGPPGRSAPAKAETPPAARAPASGSLVVNGVPVTLENYDHAMVFDSQSFAIPQVTTTSFVELGNVSIVLDNLCSSFLFVARWNLLVMANAVAFSLASSDAAAGDLAVSVDDPTGAKVGNSDVQTFSVDGLLTDTSLAGISLFTMLQDVPSGTRTINLLARRDDLGSANFAFNNYRLGVMALGFDCRPLLPP